MRDHYHHGHLGQTLVQEAIRQVRDGRPVTMRALATSAGVSPNAAYRHFDSQADLLDEVAAQWLDELGGHMFRSVQGEPNSPALLVVATCYLDAALDDPHLFRLASGVHGFGRAGGVRGAGPRGPLPQQQFQTAVPGAEAELAWVATHGLAVLAVDGPYDREQSRRLLPELLHRVAAEALGTQDPTPPDGAAV